MPSANLKQHNLMAMVAHDPKAAKRVGIPQSVGKEFMHADKGKKFRSGGTTRVTEQAINKPKTDHGKMALFKSGGQIMASKMGGFPKVAGTKVVAGGKRPHGEHTVQQKGHTKGKQVMMAGGKGMKRGGKA